MKLMKYEPNACLFPSIFGEINPDSIAKINCIDYCDNNCKGHLFTSAGNIPTKQIVQDLKVIIERIELLVLECHLDCTKSRLELRREYKEPLTVYKERLEEYTLKRAWHDAEKLLSTPTISSAVKRGMGFVVARHLDSSTEYFFNESCNLVKECVF